MSAEVELRVLQGSEFQTVGAAILKPQEAKVVRTRRTMQLHQPMQHSGASNPIPGGCNLRPVEGEVLICTFKTG